ncbi:hypothetical protein [Kocuria massiliensis]|uniref:hypothetical protein n=1 Tax=Kocuria massiliensis TaxID=1926282 RepID=UPI0022B9B5F2|nr:hypothetical protein [Kocuria massiliensis]
MANSNLGHGLFVRRGGKASDDPSGTSPREARKSLAGLFEVTGSALRPREGVLIGSNKNLLYGSTSGMQIGVRPFTMGLARQKDGADGLILMANTDVSLVDIDPAPAAGTRIDVVYVAQNESESDTTNSTPYFGVAKGVAGTPGTKPAVPQFAYELGSFTVSSGLTNLSGVSITETWQYTSLRGTPIPVRNQAERDAMEKRPGLQVMRTDRNNEIDTCDGTYWRGNSEWRNWTYESANWATVANGQTPQWKFVADGTLVMVKGEFRFTGNGTVLEGWSFGQLPAEARPASWIAIQGQGNEYSGAQNFLVGTDGWMKLGAKPQGKTFIFNGIYPVK